MSLTHKTLSQTVLIQAKWKVKAYSQALIPLLILQILMGFFNYGGGNGMSTMGNGTFSVKIHFYSLDIFLMATCLWAFITAFLIQTRGYRQTDLSTVTTRATGSIANALVLIFYSFIATIIIFMSLYMLVAVIQLNKGINMIPEVALFNLTQFLVTFFIILLASSSGYFVSSLFNLSKVIGSVFVLAFGYFFINVLDEQLLTVMKYYFEAGYTLFILKALISVALLFALPVAFLNRKEVVRG